MSIYDELQVVASELLNEFSQGTVNFIKVTVGGGPSDNPGTPTLTTYSIDAVVKGVSFKYVTQGLAVATDLEVTSAVNLSFTPSEKDFIEIDSKKYKIVQMIKLPGAGTSVVWKFIVRKGG